MLSSRPANPDTFPPTPLSLLSAVLLLPRGLVLDASSSSLYWPVVVNLTETRVTWEEGTSTKELPLYPDGLCGRP